MVVVKSALDDVHIPQKDVPTVLFGRDSLPFPENHPIFTDHATSETFTYGQVRDLSRRFGATLQDKFQWKKGDVLCILTPNTIEFGPVVWGTHFALGTASPANSAYNVRELVHQLEDSKARAIVVCPEGLSTAKKAAKQVGIPDDHILLFGKKCLHNHRSWRNILVDRLAEPTNGKIDPAKDLAFLCFSSGTTGRSKGVMTSHQNTVSNMHQAQTIDFGNLDPKKDKLLGLLPQYHIYGLMTNVHLSVFNGLETIIHQSFNLHKFLDSIERHRITKIHVVPPVLVQIAKDPSVDKYDLSSLRMITCGAAPLTHELQMAVSNRINVPIKQAYGLTETSPLVLSAPWDKWKVGGSSGWLMPNLSMLFVGEDGKLVPKGETGELWLKGPNVMLGYLNNEEATKNAFSEDGWFKTGDIGHVDEDNNVYITDRAKELIKYKGFQVAPAELEGLLLSHPQVFDACVIGIHSDEQATELPCAFIVPEQGAEKDETLVKDIIEFVKDNVVHYKQLRGGVRFVEVIPKSASGKILRRQLRDQHVPKKRESKL